MNNQKVLTFEEVVQFFETCGEYVVSEEGIHIKLTLKVVDSVNKDNTINYKEFSSFLFEPTIQDLIREIHYFGYKKCLLGNINVLTTRLT